MEFIGPLTISPENVGQTLAAVLRQHLTSQSWNQVRRLVESRHVKVNGDLCLDPARRLKAGETVEILSRAAELPQQRQPIEIVHRDAHLVVVSKPAGLNTVRHPAERDFTTRRKQMNPTLDDLVARLIDSSRSRLRIVHRLDKETSGLVVFARSVAAEGGLGQQFHAHTVKRQYLAVVRGKVAPQRIATRLVRDRGDGRRGSTDQPHLGKEAITHLEVIERLRDYSLVGCRLETGRTHQIRIHLSELGHPVCGEKVYNRKPNGDMIPDASKAPRLALHAAELGFVHPITGEAMHWTRPLPADLEQFVARLRNRSEQS